MSQSAFNPLRRSLAYLASLSSIGIYHNFATTVCCNLARALFMEAQGFEITHNILYQDNKSAILLEKNGKRSSSKRTRALNIRYFFLTDQVAKGNLQIEYESTTKMWGDFMSKPLQGKLFRKFKALIMGHGD
jgi:hypothetical protein